MWMGWGNACVIVSVEAWSKSGNVSLYYRLYICIYLDSIRNACLDTPMQKMDADIDH